METPLRPLSLSFMLSLAIFLNLSSNTTAGQTTFQVLHTFHGNFADGQWPSGSLSSDSQGNLYGVTTNGGVHGYGMVFQLTPQSDGTWSETDIYDFCPLRVCTDGAYPLAGVVFDGAGNAYGTTSYGGSAQSWGAVYQLTPNPDGTWAQTVLWHLPGNPSYPAAALNIDNAGNLFGTALGNPVVGGLGGVFELTKRTGAWQRKVLYSFRGGSDGAGPTTPLVMDSRNNFYGITDEGGIAFNAGTVFQLIPHPDGSWAEKVIYDFPFGSAGGPTAGGLVFDSTGNLYGTTGYFIFKLTPSGNGWQETTLYTFGENEGGRLSGLVFDKAGNLYGTANLGGQRGCANAYGCGTVFKLSPNPDGTWTKSTVYTFTGGNDGGNPIGGVTLDSTGNLYGLTQYGGDKSSCISLGCGVAYKITP